MIILGIDPGNVRTGYGLIKKEGGKLIYLKSGLVKIPTKIDEGGRLLALEKELGKILDEYRPDAVGLEKIFLTKNKKTAVLVAQARGIILKTVSAYGLKPIDFSPPSVKLAVTGNGRADKKAVAKMVGLFLKTDVRGFLDDVTDALAIAIAASS
jgi:crossover junction endodeoxyribonuclease RuvC